MHILNAINIFVILETLVYIFSAKIKEATQATTILIEGNQKLNGSTHNPRQPRPEETIKKTADPRRPPLQPEEGEDPRTNRAARKREEITGPLPYQSSFVTLSYFPTLTCTDKAKPGCYV